MVLEGFLWAYNRYRPREGWLSLVLVCIAIVLLIVAVLEVGWIPEDRVVVPAAIIGLLFGVVLAKRPLSAWAAWSFITIYGLLIVSLTLAQLWPPFYLLIGPWGNLRQFWLQNGALFLNRTWGWITAVTRGGGSAETITFALIMGLAAWFLAAYVGWATFRQRQPLLGLTLMGAVLALNSYYGSGSIYWIALFVGIATFSAAVLHFANLEQLWQTNVVDYSREIRIELLAYAGGIGITLLALALVLPGFSITKLSQSLLAQPVVSAAEDSLSRAFAGVRQPQQPAAPGAPGGIGSMPRAFLLGAPPELSETIVMEAWTQVLEGDETAVNLNGRHWRALSYEHYTGRGWTLSSEQTEKVRAFEAINLPPAAEQALINQNVDWIYDKRATRYTLGQPVQFNQPVVVSWRGVEDLVRVRSEAGSRYAAITRLSTATPDQLRQANPEEIPNSILARYTQLPDSIPPRVHDLAQEIAVEQPTAYDQALVLERFLRQYTYSLDVTLPPEDVDPVDFFLFDLQAGYCDYYASSMVVLARSLGLPARLATGFLAQPADEDGFQTIRQIHAHSWAEIYFADYGWIEFEPTATFITPHDPPPEFLSPGFEPDDSAAAGETPPIPARAPQRPFPWNQIWILLAITAVILLIWLWLRRRRTDLDAVELAYGRLQHNAAKIGQPPRSGQTPQEFNLALLAYLDQVARQPRLAKLTRNMQKPLVKLTNLFEKHQYSPAKEEVGETAETLWQRLRGPFRMLRILKRLGLTRK